MSDILEKYSKYDLYFDVKDKILFIYKPMLVKDFESLKSDLKLLKNKVNEIRIVGSGN